MPPIDELAYGDFVLIHQYIPNDAVAASCIRIHHATVHTDHANRVAGLLKRDGVNYDLVS